MSCPNADSCQEQVQRGNLDDHLRYRCSGTLVACQFAASGCDYRGPSKSMAKHQTECRFKKEGKNFLKTFFFLAVEVPEVVYYHTMWPCEESKAFGKWKSLINSEVKASRVKDEIDLKELSLTWLFPPSVPSAAFFQSAKKIFLEQFFSISTRLFFLTKKEWRGS